MTARSMGHGFDVSSDHRHKGAAQNHFSHLSGLGSKKGLNFEERDIFMVVRKEKNGTIMLLSQCRRATWMWLSCYRKGLGISYFSGSIVKLILEVFFMKRKGMDF